MIAIHGVIASSFQPTSGSFKVYSGSYTGIGSSPLIITGVGFTPQLVIIKAAGSAGADDPVISWTGMNTSTGSTPAASIIAPATIPNNTLITSYSTDGFVVGTNATINTLGKSYYFVCIAGAYGSEVRTGSYTAAGGTPVPMTGVGFQPEVMFIRRRNLASNALVWKTSAMGVGAYQLGNSAALINNGVISFDSDGWTLGNNGAGNSAGAIYDWIALKPPSSVFSVGAYTGTGSAQSISGLGFAPEWMMLKGNATSREAVMRGAPNVGDDTSRLGDSQSNLSGIVTSLDGDGFSVGTNSWSNSNTITYHYLALKSQ